MKKLLTFLLFSVFLLIGCNQESEITAPVDTGTNHQYKLISLPAPAAGLQIESAHTEYKYIDGEEGGTFYAEYSYQSNNGTVSQYSTLNFYEEAFSGLKNISQTFSSEGAAMVFGPSMQFQATVKYTYTIYGADLTGVNPNTLDFVYIDANGNMINVQYDYVDMDQNSGMLKVVNARLPHFSRYGFVN
jgi:hypothetical protein